MYDLLIHDCHVLTPTGDIRRNCDLVIDEGKIVSSQKVGVNPCLSHDAPNWRCSAC